MPGLSTTDRQYWLWVTRPQYYMDEDGNDLQELDPDNNSDSENYWTCHRNTKQGDLAFVWRTTPKKDIGYLMVVKSAAYSLENDAYAISQNWQWGCDSRVLYKFKDPVTIEDLREHPSLQNWKPLRANFQSPSPAFNISSEDWEEINQLACTKNSGYEEFLQQLKKISFTKVIRAEEQLKEALAQNLAILKPFGYDLELYVDADTGRKGKEWFCKGHRSFIDLLCYDKKGKRLVIIELKNVQASRNTFGQISGYIGWVQDNLSIRRFIFPGKKPIGLVISRGYDVNFGAALKTTNRIEHLNLSDLGFR